MAALNLVAMGIIVSPNSIRSRILKDHGARPGRGAGAVVSPNSIRSRILKAAPAAPPPPQSPVSPNSIRSRILKDQVSHETPPSNLEFHPIRSVRGY